MGRVRSRDWAAKGPRLLGIKFVIAESYERIHRSNLVGMGILPLQFEAGQNVESLGLTGEETFYAWATAKRDESEGDADIRSLQGGRSWKVTCDELRMGAKKEFDAVDVRIDTPQEILYYQHGGILQYVLRSLAA